MTRKSSLKKMKDVLVERRDALRQAISGDNSLLKKLSQQSGGDVVDFASDSASGEISSRLAEVETASCGKSKQRSQECKKALTESAMLVTLIFQSPACVPCPMPPIASSANWPQRMQALSQATWLTGVRFSIPTRQLMWTTIFPNRHNRTAFKPSAVY